jgi:nicotinate-nucleotide--dimethylbenzimidazole phosphoribosyltransferase
MMISTTIEKIHALDPALKEAAQRRLDSLTKPPGSLGRLERFAVQLVQITGNPMPEVPRKAVFTFAGDHGVVEAGVSAFPKEVTPQMVMNFLSGGAGINVLARHAGADVMVIDMGVDYDFKGHGPLSNGGVRRDRLGEGTMPEGLIDRKVVRGTRNMLEGPAMTREESEKCLEAGISLAGEYADRGYGLFATGDMGIGNTTPSSAIASVLTGKSPSEVTGRGTGITAEALQNKVSVIEQAISVNNPDPKDAVGVLAKVGGAEIGGIAGLCLGAASRRVPVVVDGFISTAGALIAWAIEPRVAEYMFAAHRSVEPGHMAMLGTMGLEPVLDLGLRLGEGTGAALAMHLIEAGLRIYREMATFEEAGVSEE